MQRLTDHENEVKEFLYQMLSNAEKILLVLNKA